MKSAERASLRSLLVLAALAAVVFLAALLIGSSGIGVRRALEALGGSGDAATRSVLLGVRLPRVLAAFGVGSLLALSGVLLQALFRNPLADPYVLGVSGGAAVGALLAMIAGAAALLVQSAAGAHRGARARSLADAAVRRLRDAHRARRGERRHRRLRGTHHPACRAPHVAHQRSPYRCARRGAGRRDAARGGGSRGAHHCEPAPAAGGRDHGAGGSPALRGAAAEPRPIGESELAPGRVRP